MNFLGVDPSLRHVGLCLLKPGGGFLFEEVKAEGDVLTAGKLIRKSVIAFIRQAEGPTTFCPEKQLSVGGSSSSLMFYCQMMIFEAILHCDPNPTVINPLPIQLQSYVRKQIKSPEVEGQRYVDHFKETVGYQKRISVHCVDAYYLARLGQDVCNGTWRYNLPSKEQPLTPWKTINDKEQRRDRQAP